MYRAIDTILAMSAPLTLAIILAIAIPVELFRAYRPDGRFAERWVRDRGLELTPENHGMVARYLRNARVMRTWGGAAGAILPSLIEFAWNGRVQVLGFGSDGNSAPLAFGTIFVGYLVGALCAEISLARPVPRARRMASLARRELTDYLPRRTILAQRALAVAAALGTVVIGLVPYSESVSNPRLPSLALAAAVVLALGAGVEAIERWLVRRPQPFTSPSTVAADDAIRAQSIRAVAGAGLALLLLVCSGISLALQASDSSLLHTVMVVPAAVCLVLSLFAGQEIGQGSWRVERRPRPRGAASA
jgi:hypothetical protein